MEAVTLDVSETWDSTAIPEIFNKVKPSGSRGGRSARPSHRRAAAL